MAKNKLSRKRSRENARAVFSRKKKKMKLER